MYAVIAVKDMRNLDRFPGAYIQAAHAAFTVEGPEGAPVFHSQGVHRAAAFTYAAPVAFQCRQVHLGQPETSHEHVAQGHRNNGQVKREKNEAAERRPAGQEGRRVPGGLFPAMISQRGNRGRSEARVQRYPVGRKVERNEPAHPAALQEKQKRGQNEGEPGESGEMQLPDLGAAEGIEAEDVPATARKSEHEF